MATFYALYADASIEIMVMVQGGGLSHKSIEITAGHRSRQDQKSFFRHSKISGPNSVLTEQAFKFVTSEHTV